MAINKNFVVKNGLEVSSNLILADALTKSVGIATSNPRYTLEVRGGVGVTDFYSSGISTVKEKFYVGNGTTTILSVLTNSTLVGINTSSPQYLLDIRSPVSTGQTALYVQGDVKITGDLQIDDINLDDATIQDAFISDNLIVGANGGVGLASAVTLSISGVTTTQHLRVTGVTTTVNVNATGIVTAGTLVVTGVTTTQHLRVTGVSTVVNLNATGIVTAATLALTGVTTTQHLRVTGVTTAVNVNATGIVTAGTLSVTGVTTTQHLRVTGVSTVVNLNATGITTLGTVKISSGIITASSGVVTYYGDGSGLFNTPAGSAAGLAGEIQFNALDGTDVFQASSNLIFNGSDLNVSGIITCTDLNSTSDVNLKENIQTVENALDIIELIRGVSFTWKSNGEDSMGVVAQEIEKVLPSLVHTGDKKTVNYNGIIAVLIQAIKELKQEIEFLKK